MAMAKDVNVPTITITLSSQRKSDVLLEQDAGFNPPEYTSSNTREEFHTNSTIATTNEDNNSSLTYPSRAHIPPSSTPTDLPTYDHATVDMPPSYQSPKSPTLEVYHVLYDQEPWPITKKLYFLGFIFWPLWFIGMGFSMFGRHNSTKMWGRRCAWNSLVIIVLFIYLVVAYTRTGGRLR
ncbi:4297_t:CDS:1 [Funneliformis caledonium]|uniref:4297_t:CDS:1 n=2 Tax=Funneliformis TaxID=1117308 RepID=A0A9N9G5R1_9GLOM|nr:4297_t:CDS:1 [Funneliformis caledonium]CAG8635688.1 3672_t:CDS:1 [Funneliformis mosseae]